MTVTEAPTRPDWATRLVQARHLRGLSSQDVAARCGISPQTYAGYEAGVRARAGAVRAVQPREETLHRLVDALELNPDEAMEVFRSAIPTGPHPWQQDLRRARQAARLSLPAAAQIAGVSVVAYRTWETSAQARPTPERLALVLTELGWAEQAREALLAQLPRSGPAARAPRTSTDARIPAWSQFLTTLRLRAELRLADVDDLIGTDGATRRLELGGWPRQGGHLTVPPREVLDTVAAGLGVSGAEHSHLHALADLERVAQAAQGNQHVLAELVRASRKALALTTGDAAARCGIAPGEWTRVESSAPSDAVVWDAVTVERVCARLPVTGVLAATLRAVVPAVNQHADITG